MRTRTYARTHARTHARAHTHTHAHAHTPVQQLLPAQPRANLLQVAGCCHVPKRAAAAKGRQPAAKGCDVGVGLRAFVCVGMACVRWCIAHMVWSCVQALRMRMRMRMHANAAAPHTQTDTRLAGQVVGLCCAACARLPRCHVLQLADVQEDLVVLQRHLRDSGVTRARARACA
jgi:hypothetical protein